MDRLAVEAYESRVRGGTMDEAIIMPRLKGSSNNSSSSVPMFLTTAENHPSVGSTLGGSDDANDIL